LSREPSNSPCFSQWYVYHSPRSLLLPGPWLLGFFLFSQIRGRFGLLFRSIHNACFWCFYLKVVIHNAYFWHFCLKVIVYNAFFWHFCLKVIVYNAFFWHSCLKVTVYNAFFWHFCLKVIVYNAFFWHFCLQVIVVFTQNGWQSILF